MSLIEEAIRKATIERAAMPADAGRSTATPRVRRVRRPIEVVRPADARRFRETTMDLRELEHNRVLPQVDDRAARRAYKILRTRLLHRLAAQDLRSIAITGAGPAEGKTLTAINLAFALAQDVNTWVFLVDLDLQRPQVGTYLGMRVERGLGDYLAGDATLEEVTYEVGVDRLAVVPNLTSFENSSELINSPRMHQLIEGLESESPRRILLFDLPPLLISDDVLTLGPQIDSVLFVVSEGLTSRRMVENAKELLREMNLIGVVLNRSSERDDAAYYY